MGKQAIIIGGGIAGSALAIGLRKNGFDVDVFESRRASDTNHGAFLNLAPNGVNAIRALGMDRQLNETGFSSCAIRFFNARGRKIGELDSRQELQRYGARNMMMKRADLARLLREKAEALGAEFMFAKRCVGIESGTDGIATVEFDDGTTASGDFVIGCDGIRSAIRQLIFPDAPGPVYTGLLDCGGYARLAPGEIEPHIQHMVFGRKAFFGYVARPDGEVWWFSNMPAAGNANGRPPVEIGGLRLEQLASLHRDDAEPIPSILESATEVVGRWALCELPALEKWHRGRVCLIGDAAHAVPPHAGQGASLAVEDAVVLTRCLNDFPRVQDAFHAFQQHRQPRINRVIAHARRTGNSKMPGPFRSRIRDLLLPLFLKAGMKQAEALYSYQVA